jgi:hypothetical protein
MSSECANPPPDPRTLPPDIGARKTTGLAGLDAVLGDLVPGALVCMAGRPCMGKTALLLDAAIRIHRRYATNVVFATAQEFPAEIIERAPPAARSALREIPALDVLRMRIPFPADSEPKIFLVDMHDVGATWPHVIAHRLQAEHPAGCGLMIANGWTVYPDRVTQVEVTIAGNRYRANFERPGLLLPAATFRAGCRYSWRSRVAALYGIRTAENSEQWAGPKFRDLLHLSSAARKSTAVTVLVHRPELYLASGPEREAKRGLMELANVHADASESCRSELRYDEGEQGFHSGTSPRRPGE